jgi:hypothetical protein
MAEDVTGRLTELWEAFKRLQESTPGLEVGAGRFALIPPAEVRLTGFRGRLEPTRGGKLATILVDTSAARIEVRAGPTASEDDVAPQWLSVDLSDGYRLDGQVMKHATVMARALLDRLELALQAAA